MNVPFRDFPYRQELPEVSIASAFRIPGHSSGTGPRPIGINAGKLVAREESRTYDVVITRTLKNWGYGILEEF